MVSVASCVRRCSFHLLNVFLAAVLIMFAVYHTTDTRSSALDYQPTREIIVGSVSKIRDDSVMERLVDDTANESRVEVSVSGGRVDSVLSGCDLFSGKWVYDNKSYPLYKDRECGFMFDDLACEKYGRKDLDYQRWRWQPNACDLPRFEGKAFLERIRGKRIVFVGDSINRNQWVSMVCMVESSIPNLSPEVKYMHLEGSWYTFKATEYNASIDFYWSPMLVESNNDNPSNHTGSNRMVKIGAIEKHATQWGDADLLVFNSYLWWRTLKLKVLLGGSFEDPVYKEVKMLRCYKMALQTWSKWLDTHINRTKTQLFFVSSSATHSRAEEWGMPKDENCFGETKPISKDGYWGSGSDPKMMQITEAEISKLKTRGLKIQMLNITQLSEYRKDGHPSVYRKLWRPLSAQQLSDPRNYADCSHWCLPGVPDVWNELLSAYLLHQGGSFEDPVYKEVKMLRCYKMALQTWSKWLDTHINRTKTQLFFVSSSATHSRAEEWGMPKDENCFGETKPISKDGYWGSGSDPKMMQITEAEISKLKTRGLKIQMLNITQLSEYRKDGHPSVYRKLWRPLSPQQLSDPRNYADCSHWCLPGVPDVWNELLSAYLLHQY